MVGLLALYLNPAAQSFSSLSPSQIWKPWTSLVVQWLRIHLPVQGTQVQSLVREDPTCHRAAKPCATITDSSPVASTAEPMCHKY